MREQPVIVGVGDVLGNRARDPEAAREPLSLIVDAVRAAASDAGDPKLPADVDAVYAVRTTSWAYASAARSIAEAVGARPGRLVDSPVGGHWPVALLEQAAARIAAGEDTCSLLVGGEAQASLQALQRAGRDPIVDAGWSADPGGPPSFDPDDLGTPRMLASGVMLPIRVYPMFHNAMQAAEGLTPAAATRRSAELYARFTELAAANPVAWNPRVRTADDIATAAPDNRMVCEPYTLAMNAMPQVDQAAAVLVMSASEAHRRGIDPSRVVQIWGGAGATDPVDVLERGGYDRSDALAHALDQTLGRTGLVARDLDLVDVYSCFPVVPELVLAHLDLPDGTVPSVTGGHAAFGGPLNSYSLHAAAALTRAIRGGAGPALLHANGGYMTYQHATILAGHAHPDGYLGDPEPTRLVAEDAPPIRDADDLLADDAPHDLRIETFTVEHGRDGTPERAYVIARTARGDRVAAATAEGDRDAAAALSLAALSGNDISHVGRIVRLVGGPAGAHVEP
ncbi:MAG TPA: hypothetical protein VK906_09470 [Egicoccus sp.]|nr:hypothetical protein [Egicoccus sp.]HSK23393.1 hypothetical protein [Egicoccus sp.]